MRVCVRLLRSMTTLGYWIKWILSHTRSICHTCILEYSVSDVGKICIYVVASVRASVTEYDHSSGVLHYLRIVLNCTNRTHNRAQPIPYTFSKSPTNWEVPTSKVISIEAIKISFVSRSRGRGNASTCLSFYQIFWRRSVLRVCTVPVLVLVLVLVRRDHVPTPTHTGGTFDQNDPHTSWSHFLMNPPNNWCCGNWWTRTQGLVGRHNCLFWSL